MSTLLFLVAVGLVMCGLVACSSQQEPTLDARTRHILERAAGRAVIDSSRLAGARFTCRGKMVFRFSMDSSEVGVEDLFSLVKDTGSHYRTEPLSHIVSGDTTLLDDMYTFRTSSGSAREQVGSQLERLSFGVDFPEILRSVLSAREGSICKFLDSTSQVGGTPCYHFAFRTPATEGRFLIERDSCRLAKIEVDQESSYLVGGYKYSLGLDYQMRDAHLLLPIRSSSVFNYTRLFSEGNGSINVVLDSVKIVGMVVSL